MCKNLTKKKFFTPLLPILGFGVQILLYIPALLLATDQARTETMMNIALGISFVLFFIPLLSIIGLYRSIKNLKNKEHMVINSFGLVFNLIWFALFALAFLATFVWQIRV